MLSTFKDETPHSGADNAHRLIVVCERVVASIGPKPGSHSLPARVIARLTTPLGLAAQGITTLGATFYAWLLGLLLLFMSQRGVASLQLVDLKTVEGISYALMLYFTIAIALAYAGRLVIRPSGTEPLIRVMAEGDDAGLVKMIVDEICTVIGKAA